MNEQVKDVLEMLSKEQIKKIMDSDKEYIIFDVSVFNAGAVVDVIETDEFPFDEDGETFYEKYSPYSFVLETGDAEHCLTKLKLA